MDKYSHQAEVMYDSEANSMLSLQREKTYVNAYQKVIKRIEIDDCDVVLDVGCGTGKLALAVGSLPKKYVGIDLAQKTIDIAKKKGLRNHQFFKADMMNNGFDDCSFSKVVALTSIDQVFERERALKECKRVLRPDGLMYIEVRNKDYIVKKAFRRFLPFFNKIGITKPMPIADFEDLTNNEWVSLFTLCGFEIVNRFVSARPYYGESLPEKLRHAAIEFCKLFMPMRYQYMLSFALKKGK